MPFPSDIFSLLTFPYCGLFCWVGDAIALSCVPEVARLDPPDPIAFPLTNISTRRLC